jgi:hypothetical protein
MSFDNLSNELLLVDFNTHLEVGNFEYLPRKFLNIETSKFGDTKNNPFLQLKDKVLNDHTITFSDKCQAIRYMSHIPLVNAIDHLLECCKYILSNEDYAIDKRYFFFSNNERYLKLEDNLVYKLFGYFFELCIERVYPYFFTLMCSKYILSNYDRRSVVYNNVRQFLYNISSDNSELIEYRYEAIDTLLEYGEENLERNDKQFARDMLDTISDSSERDTNKSNNIYTDSQNVHDSTISYSIKCILRNLLKDDLKLRNKLEIHLEDIHEYIIDRNKDSKYISILNRILLDPSKFEGKTLSDILIIVWRRIQLFEQDTKTELYKRFFEELDEMESTCTSGHLSRIVNILTGFIQTEDYELHSDPRDTLRSDIFASLNRDLRSLPIAQQEAVILAMSENDKSDPLAKMAVEEFITYFTPYDKLKDSYIGGIRPLMDLTTFEDIYNSTIKEYIGY